MKYEAIVIGVSSGGMITLDKILRHLPSDFALSIIIVQHQHPESDDFLARFLDARCSLTVKQADEKEIIMPGKIYIAPPNYHLLVEEDKTLSLSTNKHVNFARPSIDVLFETAADVFGEKLVGIILTGANEDGSRGLKKIKESGGLTIVQDPDTAAVDTMPKAAIASTKVDYILPLENIGPFICSLYALWLKE
ncbi:MAG: chemotaxis protein CheB [Proteobacteria bacterium]|nr:chemotaxis protein CheB [Pseudomonadota bacterium]MCG2831228.1 chemotaxis protein CheB [Desulfobacteraceae bacterium]MBU4209285.1 chemotaxis protein CheB [Pseudomonadota bacterium]MBU4388495.1 chemotaxis protein CheB [Pseudomonadota bacterium]MBU4420602.1 chemotaxis protein CheB [Pseudomonadota bacterium]